MLAALQQAVDRDPRTLAQLASAAGTSPSSLGRHLRGQQRVSLQTVERLATTLGLELRLVRPRRRTA